MRGLFITGTDTGVGKSVLSAAIVAALRAGGSAVAALKPLITGLDEPADPDWPPDHVLLARAAGCAPEQVTLVGYGPPVSPHLAAELTGSPLDPIQLTSELRSRTAAAEVTIVEGVGGILVPIADGYDVRALAQDVGLPLVIAARPGLGTINHTLLTLEAARTAGLEVRGVVLTPWPQGPSEIERSNRETIARLGHISVATLAPIARGEVALLAAAGAQLPLDEWLGR